MPSAKHIPPTQAQLTYLWRTLQNYGSNYEKIAALDRKLAGTVIGEIQSAFKATGLDSKVRYSKEEIQDCLDSRSKAIRRIKTSYDV